MPDTEKDNETALEWLKLKADKGITPDYIAKGQIEDVGSKFVRKFKENPLVPIGKLCCSLQLYPIKCIIVIVHLLL